MCIYDDMFLPFIECFQRNCKRYLRYLGISISISILLVVTVYLVFKRLDFEILKFVIPAAIGLYSATTVFPAIGYLNRKEKVYILETLKKTLCNLEEKRNALSTEHYEEMRDSLLQQFKVNTGG
jgi:hypothetical protein